MTIEATRSTCDDQGAVGPAREVIVKTHQQQPFDRRGDPPCGGLIEGVPQFVGGKVKTEEIARNLALRGDQGKAGRVSVLVRRLVVAIAKSDRVA